MLRRVILSLALVVLTAHAVSGIGAVHAVQPDPPPGMIDTFVRLDSVYIPVLALASEGRTDHARLAVVRLKHVWTRFYSRYSNAYSDDAWRDALAKAGRHVAEGTNYLQRGEPQEAHVALEPVRDLLRQARLDQGIDYFPDRLTAFHDPMEAIVLATKGRSALSDADVAELRALLVRAYQRWSDVVTATFDADRFGFSPERATRLTRLMRQESEALGNLRAALDSGDKAAVLAAGPKLKPPFAQAYKLFGDFEGLEEKQG